MIGNARVSWISKWSTCSWEWMQRECALSYLDVFPFLLFYLREYYHWIRKEAWIACPLTTQPKSTDLFFSLLHLWTASYYVHDCMLAISHLLGPSSWCPTAMRPSRVGETHSNIFVTSDRLGGGVQVHCEDIAERAINESIHAIANSYRLQVGLRPL